MDTVFIFIQSPSSYDNWPNVTLLFGILSVISGAFLGTKIKSKLTHWIAAIAIALIAVYSSSLFNEIYIYNFDHSGKSAPKPLTECQELDNYINSLRTGFPPMADLWYEAISTPGCSTGRSLTTAISLFLSFLGVMFVVALFPLTFRCAKLNLTGQGQTSLGRKEPKNNGAQQINEESLVLDKASDVKLDASKFKISCLDESAKISLRHILNQFQADKKEQPPGWDGHIYRDFLKAHVEKTNKTREFKLGFKPFDNKINCVHGTFISLQHRGLSIELTQEIIEWAAECTETPLSDLVVSLVTDFFDKKGDGASAFFGEAKNHATAIKSELE